MELEYHAQVREGFEPNYGLVTEAFGVEADDRLHAPPVVVERFCATPDHYSDGVEGDHHNEVSVLTCFPA